MISKQRVFKFSEKQTQCSGMQTTLLFPAQKNAKMGFPPSVFCFLYPADPRNSSKVRNMDLEFDFVVIDDVYKNTNRKQTCQTEHLRR